MHELTLLIKELIDITKDEDFDSELRSDIKSQLLEVRDEIDRMILQYDTREVINHE